MTNIIDVDKCSTLWVLNTAKSIHIETEGDEEEVPDLLP